MGQNRTGFQVNGFQHGFQIFGATPRYRPPEIVSPEPRPRVHTKPPRTKVVLPVEPPPLDLPGPGSLAEQPQAITGLPPVQAPHRPRSSS